MECHLQSLVLISTICSFRRLLSTCGQVLPPAKLLVLYDLSEKPEKTSEDVFSAHPLVTHHPASLPCTSGVTWEIKSWTSRLEMELTKYTLGVRAQNFPEGNEDVTVDPTCRTGLCHSHSCGNTSTNLGWRAAASALRLNLLSSEQL